MMLPLSVKARCRIALAALGLTGLWATALPARVWPTRASLAAMVAPLYRARKAAPTAFGPAVYALPTGIAPTALAIDASTGRAFVTNASRAATIIDTARATVVRTADVGHASTAVVVDERTNRAFVAGSDGTVAMLDATTGAVLRTIALHLEFGILAVDALADRVYVGANRQASLTLLNGTTGAIVRRVAVDANFGANGTTLAVDERAGRLLVNLSNAGAALVLDAASGALVRAIPVTIEPAVALDEQAGRAFLVGNNGSGGPFELLILDLVGGRLLRTVVLGQAQDVWAGALAVDHHTNRLFLFVPYAQEVHVLAATTASSLGTFPLCFPHAVVVSESLGIIFGTCWDTTDRYGDPTGPGSVYALDARTGRLQGRKPISFDPVGLAVDEHRGQVLVLSGDGTLDLLGPRHATPADPAPPACCGALLPAQRAQPERPLPHLLAALRRVRHLRRSADGAFPGRRGYAAVHGSLSV